MSWAGCYNKNYVNHSIIVLSLILTACALQTTYQLCEIFRNEMHLLEDFRSESLQGSAINKDSDGMDPCIVTSSHHNTTSNDLTSILKSHRRKRRLSYDIDGDDDHKGVTSFLASVSTLTPTLLPSKRRRRSTELCDDLFLEDTECQKHATRAKRVTKKTRKQKTVRKITKEDIFAFIHNIRLEGTRAEELSNLMTAKCFLTAG